MLSSFYSNIENLKTNPDTREDYEEGKLITDSMTIVMGKVKNNRHTNFNDYQLIGSVRNSVDYKGIVLNPEGRQDNWTHQKNQAFWLGGIEAGKTFKLITPIDHYAKACSRGALTCTMEELLWLKENGYHFTLNHDRSVTCIPRDTSHRMITIRNTLSGGGSIPKESILKEFAEFLNQLGVTSRFQPPAKTFIPACRTQITSSASIRNNWSNRSTSPQSNPWNREPGHISSYEQGRSNTSRWHPTTGNSNKG